MDFVQRVLRICPAEKKRRGRQKQVRDTRSYKFKLCKLTTSRMNGVPGERAADEWHERLAREWSE